MSVRFTIDHAARFVHAVAEGVCTLKDLEDYLDQIVVQGAMPYRKLWDCSQAKYQYTDADVMEVGARVSVYANMDPRGPIAIVATSPSTIEASLRFANLGGAKRPVKVFSTEAEARRWLFSQPEN
ncbi:hypothetical protein SAMN02745126_00958 [Enhydrobacter aerosaccus]|uniref:SpoIIAA-like n=1 Tax=Enhydrobacter aerosaccus TaxID=225324 RepID=A0A1T4KGJ7_9HYPH|nr:hypothetical protein [Enhydrobacter aerosaccus]SJZ41549.1 hypothetical protein SAMN02745126_00958 [Enhydrobacter aerosaccus]